MECSAAECGRAVVPGFALVTPEAQESGHAVSRILVVVDYQDVLLVTFHEIPQRPDWVALEVKNKKRFS